LNGTAQRASDEAPPNPAVDPRIGAVVGEKYRVERRVAEGGMGVVYAATNTWTRRAVALKFPLERRGDRGTLSATVVERFLREARAASRVEHPNAISVLDLGRDAQGEVFLVQELLEGETLAQRLARCGPRPLAEVCALLLPAMDALCEAHRQGVVHRDLKPDNVFIARRHGRSDEAKVLDFGIAWLDDADPDERLTRAGNVVGTPAYMSPEQCRGAADIDARSDVWSVALLWFEALTGERALAAPSPNETIARILTERVTLRIPGAPSALVAALQRGVAQHPDDRWPSMRAFADALSLAAQPSPSPSPSPRRRPARVAALVALALVAALATAALARRAPPRAAQPARLAAPAPSPTPPAATAPAARARPPTAPAPDRPAPDRPAPDRPTPAVAAPRAPQRARAAPTALAPAVGVNRSPILEP
jgi:serine/threonine-protein kinase